MANVENRAAEHGSIIIEDTEEYVFRVGGTPSALRVLEETIIAVIESHNTVNIDYYVGKLVAPTDPIILANITKLQLTSGVVQAVFS